MKTNVKSTLQSVFFGGLFISSILFLPNAVFAYELPRVTFVKVWIEILLLTGLLIGHKAIQRRKLDDVLIKSVLLFVVLVVVASFLGKDIFKSFKGNYYRDDGIFTLLHLAGLSFFLSLFWDKTWEKGFVMVLALSCVSNAIISLYLPRGTFGHSGFLAGYIATTLPFVLFQLTKQDNLLRKLLWSIAVCLCILVVVLAGALGGFLGIGVLLIGALLYKANFSRLHIFFILGICATLIGLTLFMYKATSPFTFESRQRIITRGILAFTARPIAGWGWANFDHAFESVNWPMHYDHDVYIDKAHGLLLEILVTTGVMGLFSYMLVVGRVLYKFIRDKKLPYIFFLAFLIFIAHSQTNVISISEELVFWVIVGIVMSQKPKSIQSRHPL